MPIESKKLYGAPGSTIRLTIKGTSPKIGHIAVGKVITVGETLYKNTKVSTKNHRPIKLNAFGERVDTITGPIVRDVTYAIHHSGIESFNSIATSLEYAQANGPVVTYANNNEEQLLNFGDIMDWSLPRDLPQDYIFQITSQGIS